MYDLDDNSGTEKSKSNNDLEVPFLDESIDVKRNLQDKKVLRKAIRHSAIHPLVDEYFPKNKETTDKEATSLNIADAPSVNNEDTVTVNTSKADDKLNTELGDSIEEAKTKEDPETSNTEEKNVTEDKEKEKNVTEEKNEETNKTLAIRQNTKMF